MTEPVPTDYSGAYDPDGDFDRWYTAATGAAVASWMRPGQRVLELGCATGLMTESIVAAGATVVGVDRAGPYLDRARARGLANADFVQGDVEDFARGAPYEHVVATNLIHEVPDAAAFLARCRDRLGASGLLHLSLQNPHSIHRLVAQDLGMISDLHEISARGRQFSTLRLYDGDELEAMGEAAGLTCAERRGIMLKPLPNDLMAQLPDQVLEGFVAVAHHFPMHCAMNYLVFRR